MRSLEMGGKKTYTVWNVCELTVKVDKQGGKG